MSKKGKNRNNSRASAEWQKQKTIQTSQEIKSFNSSRGWSNLSTLQRMVIAVLILSVVGVVLTLIFEKKDPILLEASTPAVLKPESDLPVQQGNKLTNNVIPSKDYPKILPEITKPGITEPEITKSGITEPEITEPEITKSEIAKPEIAKPEITKPEIAEPDIAQNQANGSEESEKENDIPSSDQERWFSYTIATGDTLAKIFRGRQLSLEDLYAMKAVEGDDQPLSKIVPDQELRFRLNESADLDALEIQQATRNVVFVRTPQGDFIRQQ